MPPTVLRDGPFGPGMVQAWLEPDPEIDPVELIRNGAAALRRMALFDAVANNADRKVGHLLPMTDGHVLRRRPRHLLRRGTRSCGPCSGTGAANGSRPRSGVC